MCTIVFVRINKLSIKVLENISIRIRVLLVLIYVCTFTYARLSLGFQKFQNKLSISKVSLFTGRFEKYEQPLVILDENVEMSM